LPKGQAERLAYNADSDAAVKTLAATRFGPVAFPRNVSLAGSDVVVGLNQTVGSKTSGFPSKVPFNSI
jgi:hypothetical protein